MLFHTLAWFLNDLFDWDRLDRASWRSPCCLFVLAGLAAFIAMRLFKKGAPPTPDLAIEEAKLMREQFETQKIQRDQVHSTLERGEEVTR